MTASGRVFYDGTLTRPQLDHPEGVAIHPDGSVWCGGERGQIFRIAADGSAMDEVATTDGFILGIAFGAEGDLYACDVRHRAVFRIDTTTGAVRRHSDGAPRRPFVAPNFPVVAPDGSLYVSDSNVAGEPGPGIYRIHPDGTTELWFSGPLNFANGLALSAEGYALLVVESFGPVITRIPITAGGTAGRPEPVATLRGTVPDGIAVGPDGMLYVGCYEPSQVLRVDPSTGQVSTVLTDPTAHLLCHPANVAVRGDQLFTSNLGRWHITVIDDVFDGASGQRVRQT
ncbi:SMP-30/gluconolactonase/LRE family protein [Phytoactinopolyspora limicola]|uniref:SMP-30/gluconolactonase/LRE family protein n=1 Tax=Phytoactinopolyspora limicola TaxID=2715536 RepID=UPI00140B620E|nr:SMP-30/gluconolactonase/LRE family protein [Phytoactinopolyspora limicola]